MPFLASSGAGIQRTESSGDHRRRVRGCPDHAALHGSWSANLEEVDMPIQSQTITSHCPRLTRTNVHNTHRLSHLFGFLSHANPDYGSSKDRGEMNV